MKAICKQSVFLVATALILPLVALYRLRACVLGKDRAFEGSSQLLSLWPGLIGCYLRTAFYRQVLDDCASTARIEFGALFSKVGARLGEHCYVGPRCQIGWAEIGPDVLLASGVQIPSGGRVHGIDDLDRPIREQTGRAQMVRIGAGCWIGAGAIVMADVGANSIIGAGSVVTKPIPADSIAAGVPARVLRSRRESQVAGSNESLEVAGGEVSHVPGR